MDGESGGLTGNRQVRERGTGMSKPAGIGRELSIKTRDSEVPWLVKLKSFCSDASVVGLRYVVRPSPQPFRRSVWILLLLLEAAFIAYQIVDRITYYFSHPTKSAYTLNTLRKCAFRELPSATRTIDTLSGAFSLVIHDLILHFFKNDISPSSQSIKF